MYKISLMAGYLRWEVEKMSTISFIPDGRICYGLTGQISSFALEGKMAGEPLTRIAGGLRSLAS